MSADNETSQMGGFCRDASDTGWGTLTEDLGVYLGHADEFGLGVRKEKKSRITLDCWL